MIDAMMAWDGDGSGILCRHTEVCKHTCAVVARVRVCVVCGGGKGLCLPDHMGWRLREEPWSFSSFVAKDQRFTP